MRASPLPLLALASLLALLPLLAGCATAQRGAMIRARGALQEQRYHDALFRLRDAEAYTAPSASLQAEILYLRGRALEGLGQDTEALGTYRYLIATHPGTVHAFQAAERLRLLAAAAP
jgi:hypothetical protein